MARIRTIKPEFPQSEKIGRVSRDARLLFIQLWTVSDDEGRLRGASRMLASLLYPYDDDVPDLIDGWLSELEQERCIIRYAVDGTNYIQIANWLEHQKIDRPSKSRIPEFVNSSRTLAKPREVSRTSDADLGPRTIGPRTIGPRTIGPRTKNHDERLRTRTAEQNLIWPPLFKMFCDKFPRPPDALARQKFFDLLAAGEDPDAIIAAAPLAGPAIPASQWLERRGWVTEPHRREPKIPQEARKIAGEFIEAIGFSAAMEIPPEFAGTLMRADQWHRAGWPRSMIVSEAKRVMEGRPVPPSLKYFEKVFANKFASLNAPAPVGQATDRPHEKSRSVIAAADDLIEQLKQFDEPAPGHLRIGTS